ncbi:hypothetical protein R5M17_002266 [Proteus mirabilis]|uniref:Prophage protein n=2 Tax=Proteus mirabilis TaxID=584 RepID=A0AAJ0YAW8_PROMI|nr:hypothetical protein [Proteus mirabilis]ARX33907.1 hypothetical protein AM402_07005 [Proteus mirabilis]AVA41035.1 hypothetical protein C3Z14_13855 [Proteus mirabilis]EJD6315002.1 hypothetical protein [Proteus mirabilis]EJD6320504.1 hypothetical protein [Proteus mirabilis]EJD6439207.1 hypothetical protein [Proteus mirabilis]
MSKSNLIAFRLPAELQTLFNEAISNSGSDKTAWIVSAIKEKLNRPDSNPDARILSLVERLESSVASLIAGKADIPPYTYNESAVVSVVNSVLSEGVTNGRIIAARINEAGYQTKAGKAWDKDIYSAWRRHKDIVNKLNYLQD